MRQVRQGICRALAEPKRCKIHFQITHFLTCERHFCTFLAYPAITMIRLPACCTMGRYLTCLFVDVGLGIPV